MAGWQDDPIVAPASGAQPWQNDPVAGGDSKAPSIDDSVSGQLGNALYHAADTSLFHAPDYLLAGAHAVERGTGIDPNATDLSQIRAQNEEFSTKHPIEATAADIAPWLIPGYGETLGLGKIAEAGSALAGGGRLGTALGGAGQAAALSGAGALTGGSSVGDALKAGGGGAVLGGALGGALGGVASKAPVGQSIADLQGASKDIFDTMHATPVPKEDVAAIMKDPVGDLKPGQQSGISPSMQAQIDQTNDIIKNSPNLSVADGYSFRKNLNNAARTPEDKILAKTVGDSLQDLSPDLMKEASLAHGRVQDATWLSDPEMSPADLRKQALANINNPQMAMDDTSQQAMKGLANSGPGWARRVIGTGAGWLANAGVGHVLGAGVGDIALGTLLGAEHGSGGAAGGLVKNAILNASTARARRRAIAAIGGQAPPSITAGAGALANRAYGPLSTALNASLQSGALGNSQ